MSVDNTIEWKKGTLFIENDPKPYTCFFCKNRIHFIDDIPNKMNKYELELYDDYDITVPKVNIKPKVLDKFCGTILTNYNLIDILSDVLITREIVNGIFVSDISLMDIKHTLNIFDGAVQLGFEYKKAVS
ncbi:MAG: hypothetical protein NC548_15780 [Lachnospiraceae bacterium]|nr:hypothetical protein [Lachnospiraceae bacterium]